MTIENDIRAVVQQKFPEQIAAYDRPRTVAETPSQLMPRLEKAIEDHRQAVKATEQARLSETTALIRVNELQKALDRAWEEYQRHAASPNSLWNQR